MVTKSLRRVLKLGLVATFLAVGGLAAMSFLGSNPPEHLGPSLGRLADCPDSPNCVSSFSTGEQHIAPIAIDGDRASAWQRLMKVIARQKHTNIVTQRDNYAHAESRSLIFRFVDDLEFLLAENEPVIHVRSASRSGRSDLGVNRRRLESIRHQFEAGGSE